jgi:hypothetical protein
MPIGTSDGEYFDNKFEAMVGKFDPSLKRVPIVKDPDIADVPVDGDYGMVVDPLVMQQNRQLDQIETDPTTGIGLDVSFKRPLGSPTEPAGAFKSPEATTLPLPVSGEDEVKWDRLNQPFGSVKSTSREDTPVVATAAGGLVRITEGDVAQAQEIAGNVAGTITGVKSKLLNKTKLYQAQNMELEGAHPEEIWKATGTFRGADRRWRQELPDKGMILKEKGFNKEITPASEGGKTWTDVGGKEASEKWHVRGWGDGPTTKDLEGIQKWFENTPPDLPITDVVHHPELFKAYPELSNYRVAPLPKELIDKGVKGQVSGNTIYLAPGNPEYLRSVLAHEMQHAVQRVEGFARGGSTTEYIPQNIKEVFDQFKTVAKEAEEDIKKISGISDQKLSLAINHMKDHLTEPTELTATRMRVIKEQYPEVFDKLQNLARTEKLVEDKASQAEELYRRLAGEVESRNAQKRLDMSDTERFLNSPRSTEDRPRFVQSVIGQDERVQLK